VPIKLLCLRKISRPVQSQRLLTKVPATLLASVAPVDLRLPLLKASYIGGRHLPAARSHHALLKPHDITSCKPRLGAVRGA
jgi:hypothetical protein